MKVRPPPAAACCPPVEGVTLKDTADYAKLLRALADETRLQIVALLSSVSEAMCVCEIEARFDLSQPTISHHLKVLRAVGVVSASKRGIWVYYALDQQRLDDLGRLREVLRASPASNERGTS